MLHRLVGVGVSSVLCLVADQGNDHAVEVEEEHDQMEAELAEGFLFEC